MSDFLTVLEKGIAELKIDLTGEQKSQYLQYQELLTYWNQKINLTAIKEERVIAIKHFLDSLAAGALMKWDKQGIMLDLGSGAGFPGLVLKIWQPQWQFTLVDSVQKKVNFMNLVIESLRLEKTIAVHRRAEDLGRLADHRHRYDRVVARAVAALPVLCEYCLPLVATGGYFYALKGPNYREELEQAQAAIAVLGGRLETVREYRLPLTKDSRSLIIIEKTRDTPKQYPRKSGLPGKKPIMQKQQ
ncbi:MAG: 16S rRNA (guanine(527)-N(7))-methyltransferase RsmG [Clostridia bacterium]|nr:16S rRNA (guanine(527)-N(7))-methyltransferase RsmG [Clostridia bacterium]